MNTVSLMKPKTRSLLRAYQDALRRYLKQETAARLRAALNLGSRAVALGLETLDLTLIHERALLAQVLPVGDPAARNRIIQRARLFFAETLIPMEKTHRSAIEANARLNRLNQALNRRSLDLAVSNRELKKEITRRQVVEESLRLSKQHSIRLLRQSRHLQEQLRLLSRRILSVQEEERKRISRELHDVIAQMLTGINVRLAALKIGATANARGLSSKISRTQRLVEKSVDVVHQFARELRPAVLDDLGLIPALHTFMKGFQKETGIRVGLTAFDGVEELNGAKRTVLYRVAQEALANVARHAKASRSEVIIDKEGDDARMRIKDNGTGFDVEQVLRARKTRRLGLLGMRERVEMIGGTFAVESAPGRGATVQARIPFRNGAKGRPRP